MLVPPLSPPTHTHLWQAEQQRQPPGQQYEAVPALSGAAAMRLQGAADGVVSVHRHGNDHVGGGEHPEHLQVFHQTTQEVWTGEATFDVPHQLRQHLTEEEEEEEEGQTDGEDVTRRVSGVCGTWNSATTRSATQRLSMN